MKLWKKVAYPSMMLWGAKSLIIGFSGTAVAEFMLNGNLPEYVSDIVSPISWMVGIWGVLLVVFGLIVLLYEREKTTKQHD